MQAMAEIDGNAMRKKEAENLMERDIAPLSREIQRTLRELQQQQAEQQQHREELFYQPPDIERQALTSMDALIRSSDDLLRESQSVLAETEHIGNQALQQMGRQREQLQGAQSNLAAVQAAAARARVVLVRMGRRACRSRLALQGTIAVLAWLNLYVLYCIYRKHHPAESGGKDDGSGDDERHYYFTDGGFAFTFRY
jgi:Snare region anchored in the vesicle membrane C-terminus